MQKICGSTAIGLAVAGILFQTAGPWLIMSATVLAIFSCSRGTILGVAGIMVNLANLLLIFPEYWFVPGNSVTNQHGHSFTSIAVVLLLAQVAAAVFLCVALIRRRMIRFDPDEALRRRDFSRRS